MAGEEPPPRWQPSAACLSPLLFSPQTRNNYPLLSLGQPERVRGGGGVSALSAASTLLHQYEPWRMYCLPPLLGACGGDQTAAAARSRADTVPRSGASGCARLEGARSRPACETRRVTRRGVPAEPSGGPRWGSARARTGCASCTASAKRGDVDDGATNPHVFPSDSPTPPLPPFPPQNPLIPPVRPANSLCVVARTPARCASPAGDGPRGGQRVPSL